MNTKQLEMNFDMVSVEDIRIHLNGREYRLTLVSDDSEKEAKPQVPKLAEFVGQLSDKLKSEGRRRTAETYRSALNSLLRFLGSIDVNISSLNSTMMTNYERYMKQQGLVSNTTSFYMRVLRTIYYQAVAYGYTIDNSPFVHVYTGMAKTVKRALTLSAIQKLQQLTGLSKQEELARDMFLFSFYTRGMSFIDMAYLQPTNIHNGILTYQRAKTKQQLSMRWEQAMQDIIDRHPNPNGNYLLPIIKRINGKERGQYRNVLSVVNAMLKEVGRKAGISEPLTMYVARHSWASIARTMDVPVSIISDGMGHNSERTTQIYLTSLDSNRLDSINADIINAVCHQ